MFNISFVASIANEYSALITAIATVALAILTGMYLREIRHERIFRLQKEHTENLKRKVVEPWLSEMENIGIAKRGDPPLPAISSTTGLTYEGKSLEVENEVLFDDLRKHSPKVFKAYEKFKENCKELSKKYEDLKRSLMKTLSNHIRILSWNEFYQSREIEPGFFERDYTLNFFLDSLLSGCECKIKFVNSLKKYHKNSEKLYGLLFSSKFDKQPYIGKYWSEYGKYIDKEIDEKKRDEIKTIIEALLEKCQKEFKEEISGIHGLIREINKSRDEIIKELRKLREKIFSGKCEFIGTKL